MSERLEDMIEDGDWSEDGEVAPYPYEEGGDSDTGEDDD